MESKDEVAVNANPRDEVNPDVDSKEGVTINILDSEVTVDINPAAEAGAEAVNVNVNVDHGIERASVNVEHGAKAEAIRRSSSKQEVLNVNVDSDNALTVTSLAISPASPTTSDSSSGACSEDTMSCSTLTSPLVDLPPSAFDGSHLHWKTFRQHVLAPHRIRVVEGPPRQKLPETLLAFIEAQSKHIERFDEQKEAFRSQLTVGRGFGPSPLFPPNLLPSIENEPQLARCMIPAFCRDALPDRAINQSAPLYELAVPRPGLGCGFGAFAFSNEEMAALAPYLVVTGTSVDFTTGFISPSAAIYCPFLSFERTYGGKEHRMEAANNRCAIDGAWCCRALQMFFAKAYPTGRIPATPVAFSCGIDNEFAVINYHYIDHAQAFHMSPLCRFDLAKDEHFNHFVAWIDAIGQWAITSLLPQVRDAIEQIRKTDTALLSPPQLKTPNRLTVSTGENKNDLLIKSLKTTFDYIPWRFEDDEFTPVSSSTASWGSPLVDDIIFSNFGQPTTKVPPRLTIPKDDCAPPTPRPSLADKRMSVSTVPPNAILAPGQSPPPPAYTTNPELVWQRRFNHAMDEIRDLQAQLQVMRQGLSGSSTSFRRELSGLRNTLGSVLRKETVQARNRSLSAGSQSLLLQANTEGQPSPRQTLQPQQRHPRVEPPPRLKLPTSKNSTPRSRLHKVTLPPTSPTVTLSVNGVDLVLSPKEISTTIELPTPPFTAFPRSPFPKSPLQHFWGPDTPGSAKSVPPTPGPSKTDKADKTLEAPETSYFSKISPQTRSICKWTTVLMSGWVLGAMVPSRVFSMLIVGCAVSTCVGVLASACGFSLERLRLPSWTKKTT